MKSIIIFFTNNPTTAAVMTVTFIYALSEISRSIKNRSAYNKYTRDQYGPAMLGLVVISTAILMIVLPVLTWPLVLSKEQAIIRMGILVVYITTLFIITTVTPRV